DLPRATCLHDRYPAAIDRRRLPAHAAPGALCFLPAEEATGFDPGLDYGDRHASLSGEPVVSVDWHQPRRTAGCAQAGLARANWASRPRPGAVSDAARRGAPATG